MSTARGSTHPTRPWLGFELADQHYAVPLSEVREVIRYEVPTPVPGAPADILGIINLRGNIIPVMDGCRRLGLPRTQPQHEDERFVIFDNGEQAIGVRIDAMGDVLELGDSDVTAAPPGRPGRDNDPVHSAVPCNDGFIALLDVRRLCRMPAPE